MSRLDFILNRKKNFYKDKYKTTPVEPTKGTSSFSMLEKIMKAMRGNKKKEIDIDIDIDILKRGER